MTVLPSELRVRAEELVDTRSPLAVCEARQLGRDLLGLLDRLEDVVGALEELRHKTADLVAARREALHQAPAQEGTRP